MKVLITGANGMLGRTLVLALSSDYDVIASTRETCDITDSEAVFKIISTHLPDVVIHCAAMTDVELCEKEFELAYRTNTLGTKYIAQACSKYHARLIAISTDYVFDGKLDRPYHEFDEANGGETIYGKTKWWAEELVKKYCPNHVIVRVAWLYGAGGPSFVHTMLRMAAEGQSEIKVVNDQVGNPTSCQVVAESLDGILRLPEVKGVIHITCVGQATWYEFARKIFEIKKITMKVVPCQSKDYKCVAKRPINSRLRSENLQRFNCSPSQCWEEALSIFLDTEL